MIPFNYAFADLPTILRTTLIGNPDEVRWIAWDSREIREPEATIFLALKSSNRDGHAFIEHAYMQGVRHFVVSNAEYLPDDVCAIVVQDTLAWFQNLAAWHRSNFNIPIIAITGSNGKTTVKEWLWQILEQEMDVHRSPGSYNSQLGVPASILGIHQGHQAAIIEAGVSEKGEMEKLAQIIRPTLGLLTHLGDAHADGFASFQEKVSEKCLLFQGCTQVVSASNDHQVLQNSAFRRLHAQLVGMDRNAAFYVHDAVSEQHGQRFFLNHQGRDLSFFIPIQGEAARENASLAIAAALSLGISPDTIRNALARVSALRMRSELITDNRLITIINDTYTSDETSIHTAFQQLANDRSQPEKLLIITDIDQQGGRSHDVHAEILRHATTLFGAERIWTVGPIFGIVGSGKVIRHFQDTDRLLEQLDVQALKHTTVLLKGSRRYALERLVPLLTGKVSATVLRVDLVALQDNFRAFRRHLGAGVKMMGMVKAFSYGAGSWELAHTLAKEGIDYLAVAYTGEGIELRQGGIHTPVMVMNAWEESPEPLFRYNLEPEVFSISFLERLVQAAHTLEHTQRIPVHLKLDTGMSRLGFLPGEIPEVLAWLKAHPEVEVKSILSHLAAADDPALDAFTEKQLAQFHSSADQICVHLGYQPLRHILNTAGSLRFARQAGNMVRIGIGLYGISTAEHSPITLKEITSLRSSISQIHLYPAGTPIGYGCSEITTRDARIATVPIGYADGIRRSLGNGKGRFLVLGKEVPVMGRICMDMLMLDITDLPAATEGDEVVIWGTQLGAFIPVSRIAEACNTIPYEILTSVHPRVRRLYVRE